MPTRSYVQVAADGTGKKIANVANTDPSAPDTSGNATADTTTYQQLTTAVNARGDVPSATLADLLLAISVTNELLTRISAQLE